MRARLLRLFYQFNRIQRSLGCFFVFEVRIGVATGIEMLVHATEHRVPLFWAVLWLAVTVVAEVGGDHVGGDPLHGFGDTQRAIVLLEQRKNVIRKPGFVTEFKRRANASWNRGDEFLQQRGISFHIWRQLEEYRTELARARQGLNRAYKTREKVFGLVEAFDMRDDLVRLDPKAKIFGSLRNPFLRGGFFQQLSEGEIDFDSVQLAGVVSQKFCLREFFWIKSRFPARVRPSGSADEELGHDRGA
jgi:hypothetical protein